MLPDLAAMRRRLQVSPLDDRTALVEAAVLFRAVTPARPARRGSGPLGVLELDALTSFDTMAAAERFAAALRRGTGTAPRVDSQVLGIRHRHEMHFIHLDEHRRGTMSVLGTAWRAAQAEVHATVPAGSTGTAPRRPVATAIAIWRALLLATTPVRNTSGLRLRIRDAELLSLAVRAAHVLGVTTSARSSSGLGVLCIDEPEQVNRLLERLVPRIPAMRRATSARRAGRDTEGTATPPRTGRRTGASRPSTPSTFAGPGRLAAAR